MSHILLICISPFVIDGDGLRCAGQSVRLVAINARELQGNSCRPHHPCPPRSGREARAHLQSLVFARPVHCIQEGRPSWGRIVARCHATLPNGSTIDLGCAQVRTNHAAPWPQFGKACL